MGFAEMTTRELLQMALEALEDATHCIEGEWGGRPYDDTMESIRAHLAKPEPEPVAQIDEFGVFKDLTDDYLPDGTRLYLKDQL